MVYLPGVPAGLTGFARFELAEPGLDGSGDLNLSRRRFIDYLFRG